MKTLNKINKATVTPVGVDAIVRPRTFDHFPPDIKCPVCNTSQDGECVLLEIDGTGDGKICEAQPVHLWCAVAKRYHQESRILYTRV